MNNEEKPRYEAEIKRLKSRIKDLELAINYSQDGIHLLDGEGNTVLVNKCCEEKEELRWEIVKDRNIRQLVKEGFLSDSATLRVLERREPVTLIQQNKTGQQMLVTGTPIFDREGNITRVMVNSRDITRLNLYRKQLVEAEMRLQEAVIHAQGSNTEGAPVFGIVCNSAAMRRVVRIAMTVAKVDSSVLLTGESGTGKEVVSRFIHDNSSRRDKSFIKIDCSAIPNTLFESELFGYEEGSFTGAKQKGKIGLIELADGGTLFLDEIGELAPNSQSKLLRAIQDHEFMRVGGKEIIKVDIRVISATNRDLEDMVNQHLFREDLYYRLNVIPLHLPPLRERRDDIHQFIANTIIRIEKKYGLKRKLNLDCIELLMDYEWKGNVRELENLVEQICIVSDKEIIGAEDLPEYVRQNIILRDFPYEKKRTLGEMTAEFEKRVLLHMIERGKTPVEISRDLKVDVTTIRRKLQRYKISRAPSPENA